MSQPGKNNLITDIAGIRIGNAHDVAAKTGTSVIFCEAPSIGAVAVAGGGPGTRETDLLLCQPQSYMISRMAAIRAGATRRLINCSVEKRLKMLQPIHFR